MTFAVTDTDFEKERACPLMLSQIASVRTTEYRTANISELLCMCVTWQHVTVPLPLEPSLEAEPFPMARESNEGAQGLEKIAPLSSFQSGDQQSKLTVIQKSG